jgi:sarcosine oxidase
VRAVGIDRFNPPHHHGSSHGETRITRQAIGEGEAYVPLVLRSNEIWEEVEAMTGNCLLERCGFLFITRDDAGTSHHGKSGFLERTRAAAAKFGIAHEMLDAHVLGQHFPQFTGLVGDERAYYEPGGGYLRPERCIAAQLGLARAAGAEVRVNCTVGSVDRSGPDVCIRTDAGNIVARHVVLAAGSWLPQLMADSAAARISVHRQVLHWFDVVDPSAYREGAMPTFIWTHGLASREQFYGFPPLNGELKVARENYSGAFDLAGDREVDPADGEAMAADHVRGRLAGLSQAPARSQTCHYAVTEDNDFIIDADGDERVRIVSACSGHGFKHAAAVGEAVAQLAIGDRTAVDLEPFRARRLDREPA